MHELSFADFEFFQEVEEVETSAELMSAEITLETTNHFDEFDRFAMAKLKPSIEAPPKLELKELPKHLSYAYLDQEEKLHVIIASDLTPVERR